MTRLVLQQPHPLLTTISTPVVADNIDEREFQTLLRDLDATRRNLRGLGLSAIQIGQPVCVVALNPGQCCGYALIINPVLIGHGKTTVKAMEGCLSIDRGTVFFKVQRWDVIEVCFQTPDWKVHERKLRGTAARIMQHEIDHLSGVLIS